MFFHGNDGSRLSVNQKRFSRGAREELQPAKNLAVVAMSGKVFDGMNLGTDRIVHTIDADRFGAFHQISTASACGLKADEYHRVSFIRKSMHQVMNDAPSCRHAIC